jgi:hypothetical protein
MQTDPAEVFVGTALMTKETGLGKASGKIGRSPETIPRKRLKMCNHAMYDRRTL